MKFSHANSGRRELPAARPGRVHLGASRSSSLTEGVRDINDGRGAATARTSTAAPSRPATWSRVRVDVDQRRRPRRARRRDLGAAPARARQPDRRLRGRHEHLRRRPAAPTASSSGPASTWPPAAPRRSPTTTSVPAGVRPSTTLQPPRRRAHVSRAPTTPGGTFRYYPAQNIDPRWSRARSSTPRAPTTRTTSTPPRRRRRSRARRRSTHRRRQPHRPGDDRRADQLHEHAHDPAGHDAVGRPSTYTHAARQLARRTCRAVTADAQRRRAARRGDDRLRRRRRRDRAHVPRRLHERDRLGRRRVHDPLRRDGRRRGAEHARRDRDGDRRRAAAARSRIGDSTDAATHDLAPTQVATQLVEPRDHARQGRERRRRPRRARPGRPLHADARQRGRGSRVSRRQRHDDRRHAAGGRHAGRRRRDASTTATPSRPTTASGTPTARTHHVHPRRRSTPAGRATFRYDVRVDDPQSGNAVKVNNAVAFTAVVRRRAPAPGTERDGDARRRARVAGRLPRDRDRHRPADRRVADQERRRRHRDGRRAARLHARRDAAAPGSTSTTSPCATCSPDGLDYEPGSFAATASAAAA